MDEAPDTGQPTDETRQDDPGAESPFAYVHSESFADLLHQFNASLFVTTYQAGKLVVIRPQQGRVSTLLRTFDQAMGVYVDPVQMIVGTSHQIWHSKNAKDIAGQLPPAGTHDACYLPRSCHVTGDIRVHELGWCNDELWLVNTRFSCLCTLSPDFSFVPRWKPPFVTELAAEDRCHLNGMEVVDGRVRYVTALGQTNTAGGWRENKTTEGCLLRVPEGDFVLDNLCMPHSPRFHDGRLWVLDSGSGRLLQVDEANGSAECVAVVPGYARGLAFHDRYAFIGLSQIRETATFGGLPVSSTGPLKCGVWVIDVISGQTVALMEFQQGVQEIFDVRILPGIRCPAVIGLQKDTIRDTFVIPH